MEGFMGVREYKGARERRKVAEGDGYGAGEAMWFS